MINVGLTGGIATGKSLVSNFFKELGAYIIDYDVVSHEVIEPQRRAWKKIVDHFGEGILDEDLTIDREKLGEIVFNASEERKKLESIVHPEIFIETGRQVRAIKNADHKAVIIQDIPLLFEVNLEKTVDKIIVVYTSEETQIRRLIERDKYDEDHAKKRISSQMSLDEKAKLADYVIGNDGSIDETKKQVEDVFKALRGNEDG
ncbi:MAG: dephospho-CoA kinase [Halobacteriota archaeon]|nr:dephospho-CoA kinase [Halobacteriota archaeon]